MIFSHFSMVLQKSSQVSKELSIQFYQYCCRVVGSKKVVKTKRQIINAMEHVLTLHKTCIMIIGGSIAEGTGLKGSDYDMMIINALYHVYENEADVNIKNKPIPLIIKTNDTKPGYSRIKLIDKSREKECRRFFGCIDE